MDVHKVKRLLWWTYFIGPTLGVAFSNVVEPLIPSLSDTARQAIAGVSAVLIAGVLTYAIYRFARV